MRPSVFPLLALAALLFLCPSRPAASDDTVPRDGVWPLDPVPEVARGFDPPDVPWGSGHRGVDLVGAVGQPVRSALAGTVSYAGRLAGRGVVVVSHGDTRTTYEPVAAAVSVGDQVVAGDQLGRLERPGSHCFPSVCLHWGWLRGEVYLDPLDLVGAGPVRLLPFLGGPGVGSAPVSDRLPVSGGNWRRLDTCGSACPATITGPDPPSWWPWPVRLGDAPADRRDEAGRR
ncbi:M23 family metallopeptidase [Nocardioides speluncae]|uniref:M23 family metallopeptidase n=1 Tax=Nocardioides speluncae TaxID=2670337 RepID=UPI000D68D292|nr:M23 family metallopeptidase [Nocardioides speluncae]